MKLQFNKRLFVNCCFIVARYKSHKVKVGSTTHVHILKVMRSIDVANAKRVFDEAVDIGELFNGLRRGLACAMACIGVHADHQRLVSDLRAQRVLQLRNELERVKRHDAIIVVSRQEEKSGIRFRRVRNIVQRREGLQVGEVIVELGVTVVGLPRVANGEFVEAKHVHDANMRQASSEQIRSLVTSGANQQSSVRSCGRRKKA